MSKRKLPPLAVIAVAAATALPAFGFARSDAPLHAAAGARSQLQVIQVEYRLILSRGTLKAGRVGLEAIDRGMDPHDLRLRKVASRLEIAVPELMPQRLWDGVVYLKPGIYELWCSLPGHARLGMHATLRVIR